VERYATTTDNRIPRNTAAPFWKRALGAGSGGARMSREVGSGHELYARAWGSLMLFSNGPGRSGMRAEPGWRTEIGTHASGQGGALDLFLAYERTFDDLSRPTPQPSGVLGLGVRFGAR
jgi:hypothetical protein